jgi:hypothetical protein
VTPLWIALAAGAGLATIGFLTVWAACALSARLDDELSHLLDDDDD